MLPDPICGRDSILKSVLIISSWPNPIRQSGLDNIVQTDRRAVYLNPKIALSEFRQPGLHIGFGNIAKTDMSREKKGSEP